jgi:hypothetical protein
MNKTLWEILPNGAEAIRLWKTADGPKKPEIAILRLSNDKMYDDFDNDPKTFLEGNKVFEVALNRVDHMHSTKPKPQGQKSNAVIAVAIHKINSTCVAFSEPEGS